MYRYISFPLVLIFTSIIAISPLTVFSGRASVRRVHAQAPQANQFIHKEALVVYHTNVERRAAGLPPLRWNRELTNAARQFAWDSVENRPEPYCGHEDSTGRSIGDRMAAAGYTAGRQMGENVVCGYLEPEQAVQGWMESPGHRQNILNAEYREIGTGYYQRGDGRGYVVQTLARDGIFAPVIINNEALSTQTPQVDLYIYNRPASDGFTGIGVATEMMIAGDDSFTDAIWEPYAPEKTWTLASGEGWRTVYVKLRDAHNRVTISSDTIYLGSEAPIEQISMANATTVTGVLSAEDIYAQAVDASNWPNVQFSLQWLMDDALSDIQMIQGGGQQVTDANAVGGTAFRLPGGSDLAYAWLWSTWALPAEPMVAYVRLKVSDNQSAGTVLQFSLDDGTNTYGPISFQGTDFAQPNQYQEFAVPFEVTPGAEVATLALNFYRTSDVDVTVDGVAFFTQAVPLDETLIWTIPHADQRSRMLRTRFTNGADDFSQPTNLAYRIEESASDLQILPPNPSPDDNDELVVSQSELNFRLQEDESATASTTASITCENCPGNEWWVTSDSEWLTAQRNSEQIDISVSAAGLEPGVYEGTVTVTAPEEAGLAPTEIVTTLLVETTTIDPSALAVFLPIATR